MNAELARAWDEDYRVYVSSRNVGNKISYYPAPYGTTVHQWLAIRGSLILKTLEV